MDVQLSKDLEQIVESQVKSGRYDSATAVVSDALRLLEHRDDALARNKDLVHAHIEEGWLSIERGDVKDAEEVFARIRAELAASERDEHN